MGKADLPTIPTCGSLKVNGVGRIKIEEDMDKRSLLVLFNREPTDNELRAIHDYLKDAF